MVNDLWWLASLDLGVAHHLLYNVILFLLKLYFEGLSPWPPIQISLLPQQTYFFAKVYFCLTATWHLFGILDEDLLVFLLLNLFSSWRALTVKVSQRLKTLLASNCKSAKVAEPVTGKWHMIQKLRSYLLLFPRIKHLTATLAKRFFVFPLLNWRLLKAIIWSPVIQIVYLIDGSNYGFNFWVVPFPNIVGQRWDQLTHLLTLGDDVCRLEPFQLVHLNDITKKLGV